MNRTERYLAQNPAPTPTQPTTHHPSELGFTTAAEQRAEDARRAAAQTKTKAGGWASKSLLEREMERERERQREWEASQRESSTRPRDVSQGSAPGQSWDVNQYGYTRGDSQNRVGPGIGFGAKRQIIGPRPPP
jgi:transgelin